MHPLNVRNTFFYFMKYTNCFLEILFFEVRPSFSVIPKKSNEETFSIFFLHQLKNIARLVFVFYENNGFSFTSS